MYIGAWQEYHLSQTGGSIAGAGRKAPTNATSSSSSAAAPRARNDSNTIALEDMRAALLLSLDAETTRRFSSFVFVSCSPQTNRLNAAGLLIFTFIFFTEQWQP